MCTILYRQFNRAAEIRGITMVLCISKDLPFAQARFLWLGGIKSVRHCY